MTPPIAEDARLGKEAGEDAPLDPAVERVRRKLLRFAVVNLGILFLALAVVVGALAWRTVSASREATTFTEAALTLPPGAQPLSHSLSSSELSLLTAMPDGTHAVLVFSRSDGHLLGRYPVTAP